VPKIPSSAASLDRDCTPPPVPGYVLCHVIGDGNCLYRAIAVAVLGEESQHSSVRRVLAGAALRTIVSYQDLPESISSALVSPGLDAYVEWSMEVLFSHKMASSGPVPGEIAELNDVLRGMAVPMAVGIVGNALEMWLGGDGYVHVSPLLWIYVHAVIRHDGRWENWLTLPSCATFSVQPSAYTRETERILSSETVQRSYCLPAMQRTTPAPGDALGYAYYPVAVNEKERRALVFKQMFVRCHS
jgi:hypothetical protein